MKQLTEAAQADRDAFHNLPRKRYMRGRELEMDLPEGKTCGGCFHEKRCCSIFGHIPEDEVCDWAPSRFHAKAVMA